MAKRNRGSSRQAARRRAGSKPAARTRARPADQPPSQLEAAATVAEDIVEERPAEAARELATVARARERARMKPGSLLAAKAASEYVYVAQDMRRILLVAASLFGVLVVGWLLIVVLRLLPLGFY
jgi:hypothetical protein